MLNRATVVVAAATLGACATFGGRSPDGTLAYGVPSPANAVYLVADTTVISINSPAGILDIPTGSSVVLALTFASDPGGVRATGAVESFDASMTNPMQGTMTGDLDDVSGQLELVFDARGVVEVVSVPSLSGPIAQLSPFQSIARDLFPRFPGGVVEVGASWVDTVTWSVNEGGLEASSSTIYTYTLVGDTLVDGRELQHIAISGDATNDAEMEQGAMSITQSLTGTANGFALWDGERGILAQAHFLRELEGTMTVAGMAPFNTTLEGPVTVRLQN